MKTVSCEEISWTIKDNLNYNVAESVIKNSQLFNDKERFRVAGISEDELTKVKITITVEKIQ